MRIITNDELKEILCKHREWLQKRGSGERANLIHVDLNGANLSDADLRDANLNGANLRFTNLLNADFSGADLTGVDLSNADIRYADLRYADLRWANLTGADIRYANLLGTDLRDADLRGANFIGANLRGVDLRGANLLGADLTDADLRNANLNGTNPHNAIYMETTLNLQCPEEGNFIAWKKLANGNIAKLLIPEDAKRSSSTTRKCRASKAIVLAIYDSRDEEVNWGISGHDHEFVYRVGETVYPNHWDENRWNECSNGIHFFITRREAEGY